MITSILPSYYGPTLTSGDYIMIVEGDRFGDPMTILDGHAMGSPDVDMADPVSVPRQRMEYGRIVTRTEFVKPGVIRSRSYEIRFAQGKSWSPLMRMADENGKICRRNVFTQYPCPETPCFGHFWRYENVLFDPVTEDGDVVSNEEDQEPLVWMTNMHTTYRYRYMYLRGHEQYDQSAASPVPIYNDSAFNTLDCDNCNTSTNGRHLSGWVVGSDNVTPTAAPLLLYSNNTRFASFTDVSANLPAASAATLARRVYVKGDTMVVTLNDATNSEIAFTHDRGTTFTLGKTVAGSNTFSGTLLRGIFFGGGYYWALGTAGKIFRSINLQTWTQLVLPTAMATHKFHAGTYDDSTRLAYIVGETTGGNMLVIRVDGESALNISTSVIASPPASPLIDVRVLRPDHIAVVGEDGLYVENPKATSGGSWNVVTVNGTTDIITAVLGDDYRTVLVTDGGSTGAIYERSLLTDMVFKKSEIISGASIADGFAGGDVGDMLNGANDFVMNTGSEVYIMKSCLPDG